jgi:hypothetical protein
MKGLAGCRDGQAAPVKGCEIGILTTSMYTNSAIGLTRIPTRAFNWPAARVWDVFTLVSTL